MKVKATRINKNYLQYDSKSYILNAKTCHFRL